MFFIFVSQSENVIIHNINITGPDYSIAPNTDGIDIGSKHVHVYDCHVQNWDDSYCLKAGASNVLIENSICIGGNGTNANSEKGNYTDQLPIENILIWNITCQDTWWGIRLKSGESPGNEYNGTMLNITFEDIMFDNVQRGIDVNQFNESNIFIQYSIISNMTFKNINGTYTNWAGHLDCSDSPPNIYLNGNGTNNGWICSGIVPLCPSYLVIENTSHSSTLHSAPHLKITQISLKYNSNIRI